MWAILDIDSFLPSGRDLPRYKTCKLRHNGVLETFQQPLRGTRTCVDSVDNQGLDHGVSPVRHMVLVRFHERAMK